MVADRLQLTERPRGVGGRVERQRGRVPGEPVAVRLARVFFLDVRRVGQDQRAELFRRWRAEDPAAKAGGHEPRQISAVIKVRMGQDDGVDGGRVDRQRLPVAEPQVLQALKQPAIDEDTPAADLEEVLGAGHRTGGAKKGQGERGAHRFRDIRRHNNSS